MESQINVIKECEQVIGDYYSETQINVGYFARSRVLWGYHFIPKINWGSFHGRSEKKWDHCEVGIILRYNWGSFKGWGSFRGRDHLGASQYSLPQHKQFVLIWNYEEIILSFSLSSAYSSGLCCSKTGYRYPPGKSLSLPVDSAISFPNYLLDSDLSGG